MAIQDTRFDPELSERYWRQMVDTLQPLLATVTTLDKAWGDVERQSINVPAVTQISQAAHGAFETITVLNETALKGLQAHEEYVTALEAVQAVKLDL